MFKNFRKNNKGTTLLELTVAISIFSIAILSVMQIFDMSIKGQRNVVAAQNMQESIRYTLEVMSKEIRMAKEADNNDCEATLINKVYYTDAANNTLYLLNSNNKCVKYFLDNNNEVTRLKVKRYTAGSPTVFDEDFITPLRANVTGLKFDIIEDISGNKQPRVTMVLDIEATGKNINKNELKIQTTISARHYE